MPSRPTPAPSPALARAVAVAAALAVSLGLAALAACQSGSSAPAGAASNAALAADLEKLCNAKVRSGADQEPGAQGTYLMAQWIDANITSREGRAFLVEFAQLGQDKAARRQKLEQAMTRHGLASCPLVDEWR
ncbi:MAG: hypothetical protein HS111_19875 [Kofleriaceae bacterium]|nr:hypothetical protein [Kofleriaceae bacterium]